MRLKIDPRYSAIQNASLYYREAKRYKAKAAGAEKAIQETQRLLVQATSSPAVRQPAKSKKPAKKQAQWFEKFNWFKTTGGLLVVGGKDAGQNDLLYSARLQPNDLFFHANLRGASAVIMKAPQGSQPSEVDKLEAAQFAASYSSAWKRGFGSVDVYAVAGRQVSKHSQGGFVGKGGFAIEGQREWFKNTQVGLAICFDEELLKPVALPLICKRGACVEIAPGDLDRRSSAKTVKSFLERILSKKGHKVSEGEIEQLLPGTCEVIPPD